MNLCNRWYSVISLASIILLTPILDAKSLELYVSNSGTSSVSLINGKDSVSNYAISSSNDLFVSSSLGTVSKVNSLGVVSTFIASGLSNPQGLAFNPTDSTLYIADYGAGKILKSDAQGNTSVIVSGMNQPRGLTFDNLGNLYVANSGNGSISRITTSGVVTTYATGFNNPYALAFDKTGNLFVTSYGSDSIFKVNTIGVTTLFNSSVSRPTGIAIDSLGKVFVASERNNSIYLVQSFSTSSVFATGFNAPKFLIIPEPSTWILSSIATAGLFALARFRKSQKHLMKSLVLQRSW